MNKKQLIDFEKDIVENYEDAKIKGPVHLCGGNEDQLIEIFKKVKKNDWVFSTHRSHYHALLHSNNPEWVKSEIFAKRSSHINSAKYKIFTSAIVGGNLPIALGVAKAIKMRKGKDRVWCFLGDMASQMGIADECHKYAHNFNLPITFIIEDNKFGVYTPTEKIWGITQKIKRPNHVIKYDYKRKYPHYGTGKWITF